MEDQGLTLSVNAVVSCMAVDVNSPKVQCDLPVYNEQCSSLSNPTQLALESYTSTSGY